MAEKEERIAIHQVLYPCKKCSINCNKNDLKDCDFYQNYISGITRYEAICKIGRAICRAGGNECIGDCGSCDLWEVGTEKDYAEAALNALLGDEK